MTSMWLYSLLSHLFQMKSSLDVLQPTAEHTIIQDSSNFGCIVVQTEPFVDFRHQECFHQSVWSESKDGPSGHAKC